MRADEIDVLAHLWETLPKTDDGQHVAYTPEDLDMLWHTGFIDAAQFSLEEWRGAMQPYQQGEHFVLSRSDFLGIDRYRYRGEIFAPFDAMTIVEGQYTDEGFQELVDASIAPECGLSREAFHAWHNDFCQRVRGENQLLRIDTAAKAEIAQLLQENPSPLRRLEIMYLATLKASGVEIEIGDVPGVSSAHGVAEVQASTFSLLSSSPEAEKRQALQSLEKAKLPDQDAAPTEDKADTVSLKDIRRSPRGVKT